MRGATRGGIRSAYTTGYFNPRTPCGVRRAVSGDSRQRESISIHAPHAGCDRNLGDYAGGGQTFQSTHPMRGATASVRRSSSYPYHFNPRTPCGVRQNLGDYAGGGQTFQSTHPMRGATSTSCGFRLIAVFQSTHPMRGATM